jgi:hypothetical protein
VGGKAITKTNKKIMLLLPPPPSCCSCLNYLNYTEINIFQSEDGIKTSLWKKHFSKFSSLWCVRMYTRIESTFQYNEILPGWFSHNHSVMEAWSLRRLRYARVPAMITFNSDSFYSTHLCTAEFAPLLADWCECLVLLLAAGRRPVLISSVSGDRARRSNCLLSFLLIHPQRRCVYGVLLHCVLVTVIIRTTGFSSVG